MRSGDEERRSEGRFCGLPGPGGPARLRLAGRSRDVSGSGIAAVLGAPGTAWGSRGAARSREDGCARGCAQAPGVLRAASSVLPVGLVVLAA